MSEFRIHHDVSELLSLLRGAGGGGAEAYVDLLQRSRTPYVSLGRGTPVGAAGGDPPPFSGKYLNVVRECGRDVTCPAAAEIVYTLKERAYVEQIERAFSYASKVLLDFLLQEQELLAHLRSIKRYFLMDQGDFFVHFMDLAEEELRKPVDDIAPSRLEALLELALAGLVAEGGQDRPDGSGGVPWTLITSSGIDFEGTTVGLAQVSAMCSRSSGAVNQDHHQHPIGVASTMAHEMGHNLGMDHDQNVQGCYCPVPAKDGGCVMAATLSSSFPRKFSYCSQADLETFVEKSPAACLGNPPDPDRLVGGPTCGNQFVERGEQCDCGTPQDCQNPCCNATTCQLVAGAQCAQGWGGASADAPPRRRPGCLRELLPVQHPARLQCHQLRRRVRVSADPWGRVQAGCGGGPPTGSGALRKPCLPGRAGTPPSLERSPISDPQLVGGLGPLCSTRCPEGRGGSRAGWPPTSPVCSAGRCGVLFCEGGQKPPERSSCTLTSGLAICQALGLDGAAYEPVPEGTKCGEDKVCWQGACQDLRVYRRSCSSECGPHGVCNHKGQCHCQLGWAPPDCTQALTLTRPAYRSFLLGMLVPVALLATLVLAGVVIRRKVRRRSAAPKAALGLCNPTFREGSGAPATVSGAPELGTPAQLRQPYGPTASAAATQWPLPVPCPPARPPAVMLAEIVKLFRPRLVDLHNYVPTCNTDQKLSNWSILNRQAPQAPPAPPLPQGRAGRPQPGGLEPAPRVSPVTVDTRPEGDSQQSGLARLVLRLRPATGEAEAALLRRKVFHKLRFCVAEADIRRVVANTPGAIEPILCVLRQKVEAGAGRPASYGQRTGQQLQPPRKASPGRCESRATGPS
ncbi:PREDICTED: disintegrin and metalloproteinase domain-containing protein 8 [Condylura cristata]|uniref:disintegrin and metalloproteinase domain-containing protein 8 n=1 Tax=Condylura cristata TaxID=143302 RepID=UPI00064377B4|nr:PREDICTED: disintegrin and metalloproteinase domain-containing protein 8 [Condylura cristata]